MAGKVADLVTDIQHAAGAEAAQLVVTAKQELAMAPTIESAQAKGFGLWAPQAVMNGRGDAPVHLARTALFR